MQGRTMHVCFIEDTHLHGGTQIWVTEAARYFLENGIEATVLSPDNSWVAQHCRQMGARIAGYDFDDIVENPDVYLEEWAAALEEADIALCTVHPPRGGFHCSVFAARVIKECGFPTTLVPKTGTIVPSYLREFYIPEEDINCHVIAITRFTREYLVSTYGIPAEQVSLVYQGTDVDRFTRNEIRGVAARERYPLPSGTSPVLGNVGSFEERKGQIILLKAFKELLATDPKAHLLLVGDGPDEEILRTAVSDMALDDHVNFYPFTSEPENIYEVIDILTLPSLYKEGLPNVLLEAMSMEVPVVASRLAGVPEVVQNSETGYIVEPGDVSGLTRAIHTMWEDSERYRAMARNARKLMEEYFDKWKQFDAFITHFHTLIQQVD
jgi:glycosyltransferase involved in cell wall biosynthesis